MVIPMRIMKPGLLLLMVFACCGENPGVVDTLVDDACCRGNHISTRPHNRKVVYHAPTSSWFVFHGTGGGWHEKLGDAGFEREMIGWRHSRDGLAFSKLHPAVVGNGHSSSADTLLVGNRIYELGFRRTYWRRKAGVPEFINGKLWAHRDNVKSDEPVFHAPYEVFPFDIVGDRLVGRKEGEALPGSSHVGAEGPHYGSLTRDSKGHIWVAGRARAGADERYATWVARSKRPDDISEWERHTALFTSGAAGTHAPQVMALDEGRVAGVLFVKPERMTMVFLYDPGSGAWAKPHILGKGYESKRASAVFDPGTRRLHVIYTDEAGAARHRALAAPYTPGNWSPPFEVPGTMVAPNAGTNFGDDDLSLSANLSRKPAPLALVHRGPDWHLHLAYYDGKNWSPKDIPVGLQDPAMSCDEVSAVADFSHGLGFLYWCQWKDPAVRKQKDEIGQLRFGLVKDVAALFASR